MRSYRATIEAAMDCDLQVGPGKNGEVGSESHPQQRLQLRFEQVADGTVECRPQQLQAVVQEPAIVRKQRN